MALIICSECGKEYSDKAPACPNCGCPTTPGGMTSVSPPPKQGDLEARSADSQPSSAPTYLIRRAKSSPGWVAALMFVNGPIAGTFFAIRHRCKALALWPIGIVATFWLISVLIAVINPGLLKTLETFGLIFGLVSRIVFASIGSAITDENKISARKKLNID